MANYSSLKDFYETFKYELDIEDLSSSEEFNEIKKPTAEKAKSSDEVNNFFFF